MTTLKVALSTVQDGSMLYRHDMTDPTVIENRQRFLEAHDIDFSATIRVNPNMLERATITKDTDYCRYEYVGSDQAGDGMTDNGTLPADALATDQKGIALILPVADCVGAVFFDPVHDALMVSHLGRHSLEQEGTLRSITYMTERFGSVPAEIKVWLTPAPSKEAYTIWALDNKGMKEATFEQLAKAGILNENITDDSRDTASDTDFYSYSEFLKGNRKEDGDHMIAAVMH